MKVADRLWQQMLALREECRGYSGGRLRVAWFGEGYRFCDRFDPHLAADCWALLSDSDEAVPGWNRIDIIRNRLWLHTQPDSDPDWVRAARLYVPICVAPFLDPSRTFMVVHMAQTIDGMIATEQGNSQWIGNDENLVHAHRVRALVDGVIVGGTTAKMDLPGLNVRHVSGSNPVRIILSDSFTETGKLPKIEGMRTILLRSKAFVQANGASDDFELVVYDEVDGRADVSSMLADLRRRGVRSVLLEGGPQTFRTFFEAGAVDFVHTHIAPMIMGSGRPMLILPKISKLADSVDVQNPFYVEMGDAIMVVGQL